MNKLTLTTAARISASGLLALTITACGSDKEDSAPIMTASSSEVASSSSSAPSSMSSEMSSSSAPSSMSSEMSSSSAPSSMSSEMSSSSAPAGPDAITEFSLDFEGITSFPDGFNPVGEGISIVNEGAAFGSGALQVSAPRVAETAWGSSPKSYLSAAKVSGTHWGRLYYRNTMKPDTLANYNHNTLVWGADGGAEFRFVDTVAAPDNAGDVAGKYQHIYNTEPNDLSLEGPYDNEFTGQWVCFEWSMDAAAQEIKFYIDGSDTAIETANNASMSGPTNATDLETAKSFNPDFPGVYAMTPVPAVIDELRIGIQSFVFGGYSFLLDNIAIGQTRLGCETVENPVASSSSSMSSSSEMSSSSAPASSSSEMSSSSSAPSGPTEAEVAARVAAGKVLYEGGGNTCVNCHGLDGASEQFNQILDTTRDYDNLVGIVASGIGFMPACAPAGDCAEQITDYMWVEFLGGTLTEDGGVR